MKQKIYIILGIDHSGTCLLSKALIDQGIDMGERSKKIQSIKKKSFESLDFINLNSEILKIAKGTWDDPPSQYNLGQAGRVYEIKEEIKKVVNKRNIGNWGWNDPKTCLTLPYFLEQLDGDVHLISIFRKPLLAAKSLKRRNGFSIKRGMELVGEYNRRLLGNIRSFIGL